MLNKKRGAIIFIFLLALGLRFIVINQSLWLDEAIGAYAVKNFTYKSLLTEFMKYDFHPPLYYLILKFWTSIFGYSEVSLRFPSIIFGIGTIWITYLIARIVNVKKGNLFPILTALFLTISQFHIYYSHEARMYGMAAFLASLSIYSMLKMLINDKNWNFWNLATFSFSITALIFSDYMPVFLYPLYLIAPFIYRKDRGWWKKYLLSFIVPTVFGLLWLPTLLIQSSAGKSLMESLPAWRNIIGGSNIKQLILVWNKFIFGRISLINKPLYYFLIILTSIPVVWSFFVMLKKRTKEVDIIALWLIIPLGLGFLASFFFPAFNYFRYVYVLPAFYLLVAWGISGMSKKVRVLFVTLFIALNALSVLIYFIDIRQHREQWREATASVTP